MTTEENNLNLYQDSNTSLSHFWQRVYQFFVLKGLELKLELYELLLNINFSLVIFLKPAIYLANKPTIYKHMGQYIMPISKLFLIYSTLWFQILLIVIFVTFIKSLE